MHITIDIRSLMDHQKTGVGEYTENLLHSIFQKDNTNQYYLFYNSRKDVLIPKFNYPNVNYIKFNWPNKILNLSLLLFKYPKLDHWINKKINKKINLFIFPNLNFYNVTCSYIITCHDLSYKIFPRFYTLKSRLWHKLINPKKKYQEAKTIIAVSQNTKNDLIKTYNLNPEKISVIHSGLSHEYKKLDLSDPSLTKVREKYNLPRNFYLYLGTLEPRKNIETLIDAFNKIETDKHLVIAGKPGWKYKSIYQKAKSNKKIHFINFVDHHDKVYLYNLAYAFIFPSYYEGFGFPPLEAMACGCPSITSHTASLPEILEQATLYIDPYNVNSLISALKNIEKKSIHQKLQQKSFKQSSNYQWSNTVINFTKNL